MDSLPFFNISQLLVASLDEEGWTRGQDGGAAMTG